MSQINKPLGILLMVLGLLSALIGGGRILSAIRGDLTAIAICVSALVLGLVLYGIGRALISRPRA